MLSPEKTRWTSSYDVMQRYVQLRPLLSDLDYVEVEALLPTASQNRAIYDLMSLLLELQILTKDLQRDDLTLEEVRDAFYFVIEDFPDMVVWGKVLRSVTAPI